MLDRDQIIQLLQLAAAYDRRTIGEADIAAWSESAHRGRWASRNERGEWTNDLAADAIKQHYATSTAYLMPGHITALIQQRRRVPPPPPNYAALPQAKASDERRAEVMTWVRGFTKRRALNSNPEPSKENN